MNITLILTVANAQNFAELNGASQGVHGLFRIRDCSGGGQAVIH